MTGRRLAIGRSRRGQAAWGLAIIAVVAVVIASLADPRSDVGTAALAGLGIASFTLVGALLIVRVPTNPIGALLLAAGTVLAAAVVLGSYANIGSLQRPPWPGSGAAGTIGQALFIYPIVIALIGIPLVFPNGRLPSRRFRWAVRLAIANMVVWTLEVAFGLLRDSDVAPGIPGLGDLAPIFDTLNLFVFFATIATFGAGVLAIWLRFRRGDPVQRQQMKLLVAVVAVGAIVFPVAFMLPSNGALANALTSVGLLALFAQPVAIGIAVLRYRLFEIDRIVSRTIAYTVVTGSLAVVFGAVVLVLQGILGAFTQGQTIAVAASTLAVFALFQPLRRRVQRAVDLRFDRARYDTDRTIQTFTARLRDEVDLESVRTEIVATTTTAFRPTNAAIWLRETNR